MEWLIAIMTAVIRIAVNFKIPLIIYGEEGEVEYGGSIENKHKALYDINYIKRVYLLIHLRIKLIIMMLCPPMKQI